MADVFHIDNYRPTERAAPRATPLQHGGGGGTYGGMDIVDAKIAAAEARTDTKFAGLKGSLDLINERLDNIERATNGVRLNVWLAAATALALGIAAMAFGASQFGNGVMVTSVAVQDASEAKRLAEENASEVKAMRQDLGQFIQAFQKTQPPQ